MRKKIAAIILASSGAGILFYNISPAAQWDRIWNETYDCTKGAFIQETEWRVDENQMFLKREVEFENRETGLYYKECLYHSLEADEVPYCVNEVSEDGGTLVIQDESMGMPIERPLTEPVTLESLLDGIWFSSDSENVREIQKRKMPDGIRYEMMFSEPDHQETSQYAESMLEERSVVVWTQNGRKGIWKLEYHTKGVVTVEDKTFPVEQDTIVTFR